MSNKCELEYVAKGICSANKLKYIQFIDAGAFKETYLVEDQRNNCYALKVFKPNNSSERTDREIDAMRRASCTNVAQLLKVDSFICSDGAFLYLYEEYLAGGTLGELMRKSSSIAKEEIIAIGSDLINALEATYNERIVHRDIKPDNIMFRGNRTEAVLVDFGLVRDLDATSLTQAFHMRGPGTALYSAPEQLNNQKPLIDWRTDQFALGITLCEAALGMHPFEAGSHTKTVEKIASMASCNDTVKKELVTLGLDPLIKMLEPYPIKRYRTPNQLRSHWDKLEA
jgi:serine/threonine protein kinase